jgi:signal transduction histidine kinase/CheY-like chemotaxis protein
MGGPTRGPRKPWHRLEQNFARLERLGAGRSPDARAAQRIVLANRLTLSYILVSCPFFLVYKQCGMDALAWALVPMLAWLALTLPLNARGWTRLARLNLATAASVSITAVAIALGRGSGAHNLLLAATVNFLILFDWEKEKAFMAAGLAANSALYLGYQSLSFRVGTLYALEPDMERLVRIAVSMATLFALIAGVFYFLIGNVRAESALVAAREKAQAADRIKSRFIANMSHEIRTPLNVILGLARLMENPELEPKRALFLANIRSSAADLLAILNDVLDLSKIESGMMKLESAPLRIGEIAESVAGLFRPQAAGKGLGFELDLDLDQGDLGPLRGDALRLRQVLNNLLSNALKFTAEGDIRLRIRRAGRKGDRVALRFEVTDTGVGIPPEAVEGLFQPFRQADDGITRSFGGSGLGLAICKRLVELMGGAIQLRSRPGAGTTVSFTALFAPDDGSGTRFGESAPEAAGQAAGKGEARILIVEDYPLNRMVLQGQLNVLGFRADEAEDGKVALEACAKRAYDLILMDCHMPNMDGIECTRRIRSMPGPRPAIIGVTADALPETRKSCLAAGMDRVLLKPLQEGELRKILAPWKAPGENASPGPGGRPRASEWVDFGRLDRLAQATRFRDPEYRKKAIAQFRTDAQALHDSLREAGRSGDAGRLKDAAHGLKGLSLTLGLDRLADTCKRIEAASAGASPDWSPVLADLDTAFASSLADLDRWLDAAPGPAVTSTRP